MERQNVTATLNKAQKLYEKLKAISTTSFPAMTVGFQLPSAIMTPSDQEAFLTEIRRQAAATPRDFARTMAVLEDTESLREAIFAANQRSGASKKMSLLKVAKVKLATYTSAYAQVESATLGFVSGQDVTPDFIARVCARAAAEDANTAANNQRRPLPQVRVRLAETDDVKKQVDTLRTEINNLEDELAALNANTKLTVELSARSREILGLV